ncbi:MAG: hypothetical protein JO225_04880 [Candidatus Eremiobacteraeota bacterium]|nr:hypothetical protein [Candidatus Eremiobacteraeota bacterium]
MRFSIVIASESATISGVGDGRGSSFATSGTTRCPNKIHAPLTSTCSNSETMIAVGRIQPVRRS